MVDKVLVSRKGISPGFLVVRRYGISPGVVVGAGVVLTPALHLQYLRGSGLGDGS